MGRFEGELVFFRISGLFAGRFACSVGVECFGSIAEFRALWFLNTYTSVHGNITRQAQSRIVGIFSPRAHSFSIPSARTIYF